VTTAEPLATTNLELLARRWDAAIVGAGPAGAMTALQLARGGHRVLLLDRSDFPREKVCGDGLLADSLDCLRRAGLYEKVRSRGRTLASTAVYSPARVRLEVPGEYLTVKRTGLDHLLVAEAIAAGAVFARSRVVDLEQTPDRVRLSLAVQGRPVEAGYAVLATGAMVELAGRAGLLHRPPASGIALRCYVRSAADLAELVVSFDRSIAPGYAWVFPLAGGEYNIGCGIFGRPGVIRASNLRQMFATLVAEFPPARRVWDLRTATTPLRGGPLRCGLEGCRFFDGRILAVGETTGTTYPFTGEGIGKAMESGECAARALARALQGGGPESLADYVAEMERRVRPRYRGYRAAEKWLSKPWLADLVAHRAVHSRHLSQALAGILRDETDPRAVFSLGGLLMSFLF
jgi:geranylgeranyl reductase family protein